MPYAVMVFIVLMGLCGMKVYSNGYDSGRNANKADVLDAKNSELTQLNQDNEILRNRLGRVRREKVAAITGIEDENRIKLKDIERKHTVAMDDLSTSLRVQLMEAHSTGENDGSGGSVRNTSFISGLEGTEGSKLTPKTRYDLELLSLDGDTATVLLELCTSTYEAARE